ncbi:phage terminase small subunit [Dasania marina]|uniref:phage terminase small subunit n=1 Tax=Dasania marina TaxID=471499 RepID=UPI0004B77188|nr:phage terminase small subunit [Dasania marina]
MSIAQRRQQQKLATAKKSAEKVTADNAQQKQERVAKRGPLPGSTSMAVQRQQKKLAALAKQQQSEATTADQNALAEALKAGNFTTDAPANYDTALAQLEKHRSQLEGLVSVKDKEAFKAQIIGHYMPFLEGYIESEAHYHNEVLTTLAIWAIDVDDLAVGMRLANYAVEQQQPSPRFIRSEFAQFITEQVTDWAQRQFKAGASAAPYFDALIENIETNTWLVEFPIALSKMYKQAALFAEQEGDLATAVAFFEKCIAANPEKHGVKTKYQVALTELAKLNQSNPQQPEQGEVQ